MIALVCVEAIAIGLLALLVAGLLRSHADILRALNDLGVDMGTDAGPPRVPHDRQRTAREGEDRVSDLAGVSPTDEAVRIAVRGTRHDTLLAFLTSGCTTCMAFWDAFRDRTLAVPGSARVVVVVHDPSEESVSRVRSLATEQVPVVMSTKAWEEYDVPVAPYFIYVSGPEGRVLGEGAASTWGQVSSLLGQSLDDLRPAHPAPAQPPSSMPSKWPSDRRREARADRELMAADILPGDPRLHPSRLDQPPPAGPV